MLAELALVLARLFGRGGNRVGALLYDTGDGGARRAARHRPQARAAHRRRARQDRRAAATAVGQRGSTTDLAAMLDAVAKLARRRALIVVISDFIGDGDWGRSLLRLVPRHEVVALRVIDAADDELPDVGLVVVEDAETGEQLVVDSGDPLLRARLRAGVEERDARLAAGMRRAGVPIHRIGTDADLATALIEVVASTQAQARVTLADPVLLAVGLLVTAGLAWAAVAAARRRAAALAAAGIAAGGPGRGRRTRLGGVWFTIAGVAVLAVAVAGPAASVPVSRASGTVILAMDVSGSMAATDVAPSRLGAAKQAALSFINAQPGQRGHRRRRVPAGRPRGRPADRRPRRRRSAAIGRLTVSGGTSLGDAILASLSAITRKTVAFGRDGSAPDIGYWPSATIVLFSDGQDETGGQPAAPTPARPPRWPQKAGVHIDTVGVGTTAGTTVEVDGYHLFTALDEAALTVDLAGHRRHLPSGIGRERAQRDRLVHQPAAHRHPRAAAAGRRVHRAGPRAARGGRRAHRDPVRAGWSECPSPGRGRCSRSSSFRWCSPSGG